MPEKRKIYLRLTNSLNWGLFELIRVRKSVVDLVKCDCPHCKGGHSVRRIVDVNQWEPLYVHKDQALVLNVAKQLFSDCQLLNATGELIG